MDNSFRCSSEQQLSGKKMSSSGPDTLHLSDMASSDGSRLHCDRSRAATPKRSHHPSSDYKNGEGLRRLEVMNLHLIKENDVLRERVKLTEENLHLHGVQILSDVVHMLDTHHIKCDRHRARDVSPSPLPRPPESESWDEFYRGDNPTRSTSHSPYSADLESEHKLMADLSRSKGRSKMAGILGNRGQTPGGQKARCHFSPSIDSMELEEALSKSVSLGAGRPKYTRHQARAEGRPSANCNVNGNHRPQPDMGSGSFDLRSSASSSSGYFDVENRKKARELSSHWEKCKHKGLHVPPRQRTRPGRLKAREQSADGEKKAAPTERVISNRVVRPEPKAPENPRLSRRDGSQITTVGRRDKSTDKRKTIQLCPTSQTDERGKPQSAKGSRESERVTSVSGEIDKLSLLESSHTRVIGEIAFQLDKRILSFVLNGKFNKNCAYKSFYGYTVLNLHQRIVEREAGEVKEIMLDRYSFLMSTLLSLGYAIPRHSNKAVTLVNKYGVMKQKATEAKRLVIGVEDEALLRGIARRLCPPEEINDVLTLLQCLVVMAADDGMPLFIW